MTTIDRATQLSDATFSGIEVAFYYLFATPVGGVIWGVLAFLVLYSIAADAEERNADERRRALAEQRRAEEQRRIDHRGIKGWRED